MAQKLIGLVGPIASGKGVLAKSLQQKGYFYVSLSDRVREECLSRELPLTRENLQNVGNDLREHYGSNVLAERSSSVFANTQNIIVVDSIRNPGEIIFLKENFDITIIGVDAPEDSRLDWYLARSKERGEDSPSPADFYTANSRDLGVGESGQGQQVSKCLELSDYIIQNNGTKDEFLTQLDKILDIEGFVGVEGAYLNKERK